MVECLLSIYKVLSLILCCKVKMDNFSSFVFCAYVYALVCVCMFSCVLAYLCVSAYGGLKLILGVLLGHSPLYFLRQDLLLTPEFKF